MGNRVRMAGSRCERCGYVQSAARGECARCSRSGTNPRSGRLEGLLAWALPEREGLLAPTVLGLALATVGFAFVFRSPTSASQESATLVHQLISMADLVFHEAGHWILAPFGRLLSVAGGALFEVGIPMVCLLEFWRRDDRNGAAFALWWTGQALTGVAIYAADARAGRLVLLGGRTGRDSPGYHDWNNLLDWSGLLWADQAIGWLLHLTGAALILGAVVWCGWRAMRARLSRLRPDPA